MPADGGWMSRSELLGNSVDPARAGHYPECLYGN
jgi:hypothetical protein